jgi:hypothetical protein
MRATPALIAVRDTTGGRPLATTAERAPLEATRLLGAAAIFVAGGVHLYLYAANDFRAIPTIGTLFLLNAIIAGLIGLGLLASRSLLGALLGIGFAVTSLLAFVISAEHGLFGWKDTVWTGTWQEAALASEAAAALLLTAYVVLGLRRAYATR